jgi:DNA-binding SARP family transcriptional activator
MPILSLDAGNTGDEDAFQIPQGENVINYFQTHGADTTCLDFKSNLQYYGASFDVVTAFINRVCNVDDINISRHICNSLLGWLAIFIAGLIAYHVGGFRAACFTMLLLFLSPRFLGHSFNNPKDLPFASAVVLALYGMLLFFKQFPKVKWYTYLILTFAIAFAISVRIGGLILFGYFGLFGLIYLIHSFAENKRQLKLSNKKNIAVSDYISGKMIGKMLIMGLGICVVGYFAGLLLWPYALQAPIKHPMEAFKLMSSFDVSIRQLFEGSLQWSDVLPWYYTPKYIFMTIPIAVIVGLVLFFVCCWRKKEDRFWTFFVFFTFFFPVFWIVFTHANVYGGWRHAMFAYPPMVVAAGWGFDALVTWIEEKLGSATQGSCAAHKGSEALRASGESSKKEEENSDSRDVPWRVSTKGIMVNIAAVVVLLALLIGPIRHIIANHPYEYVYFNELAGDMDKAYGNYEMDYYYHSTREASEWIIANAEPNADGSKIIVATWHTASVNYFLRKDTARFITSFSRWYEKGNNNWDYAIFTITGMAPEQIKNAGAFPPPDCIKTIDVDGKPICLILKRQSKIDMLGNQYKSKNQADSAILCFKEALAINPYNEAALNNIIECYLMRGQLDSAKTYIDQELSFLPKYETANYFLAHYYMTKGEMDKAIETCKFIIDCNFKFTSAYHLMCNIYLRQNDIKNAEKALSQLIDHDQLDNAGVQQLINIYKADGLDDRGAYRKLYKKMAKSLESRGKKEEAQIYWDLYKQLR